MRVRSPTPGWVVNRAEQLRPFVSAEAARATFGRYVRARALVLHTCEYTRPYHLKPGIFCFFAETKFTKDNTTRIKNSLIYNHCSLRLIIINSYSK